MPAPDAEPEPVMAPPLLVDAIPTEADCVQAAEVEGRARARRSAYSKEEKGAMVHQSAV